MDIYWYKPWIHALDAKRWILEPKDTPRNLFIEKAGRRLPVKKSHLHEMSLILWKLNCSYAVDYV